MKWKWDSYFSALKTIFKLNWITNLASVGKKKIQAISLTLFCYRNKRIKVRLFEW